MADTPKEAPDKADETWNPWEKPGQVTPPSTSEVEVPPPPNWPSDLKPSMPANVDELGETDPSYVPAQEVKEQENEKKDPHVQMIEALERIENKIDKIAGRL